MSESALSLDVIVSPPGGIPTISQKDMDDQNHSNHTMTNPTTPPTRVVSPLTLLPLATLSACFAFLTPRDLIAAHAVSHTCQAAAEHTNTFKSQIVVKVDSDYGLRCSGPQVLFRSIASMKLALASRLFTNFRMIHLIDVDDGTGRMGGQGGGNGDGDGMSGNNFLDMIRCAAQFKSLQTLRITRRLTDHGVWAGERIGELLQSTACKYLHVLLIEIGSPSCLAPIVRALPSSLRHLQFQFPPHGYMPSSHYLPRGFGRRLLQLTSTSATQLETVSIIDEATINRKVMKRYIDQRWNQQPYTPHKTQTSDLTELLYLAQSSSIHQLHWLYPIDLAVFNDDEWPIAHEGWKSLASAPLKHNTANTATNTANNNLHFVNAEVDDDGSDGMVVEFRHRLSLSHLYLSHLTLSQSNRRLHRLFENLSPDLTKLTILSLVENPPQPPPMSSSLPVNSIPSFEFQPWPDSVRESLRELNIRIDDAGDLTDRIRYLTQIGLRHLTILRIYICDDATTRYHDPFFHQLHHLFGEWFQTCSETLEELVMRGYLLKSYEPFRCFKKLKRISGLWWDVEQQTVTPPAKAAASSASSSLSLSPVEFGRIFPSLIDLDVNTPPSHTDRQLLRESLFTYFDHLPHLERFGWNQTRMVSKKLLKIQFEHSQAIRAAFTNQQKEFRRCEQIQKQRKERRSEQGGDIRTRRKNIDGGHVDDDDDHTDDDDDDDGDGLPSTRISNVLLSTWRTDFDSRLASADAEERARRADLLLEGDQTAAIDQPSNRSIAERFRAKRAKMIAKEGGRKEDELPPHDAGVSGSSRDAERRAYLASLTADPTPLAAATLGPSSSSSSSSSSKPSSRGYRSAQAAQRTINNMSHHTTTIATQATPKMMIPSNQTNDDQNKMMNQDEKKKKKIPNNPPRPLPPLSPVSVFGPQSHPAPAAVTVTATVSDTDSVPTTTAAAHPSRPEDDELAAILLELALQSQTHIDTKEGESCT